MYDARSDKFLRRYPTHGNFPPARHAFSLPRTLPVDLLSRGETRREHLHTRTSFTPVIRPRGSGRESVEVNHSLPLRMNDPPPRRRTSEKQ